MIVDQHPQSLTVIITSSLFDILFDSFDAVFPVDASGVRSSYLA